MTEPGSASRKTGEAGEAGKRARLGWSVTAAVVTAAVIAAVIIVNVPRTAGVGTREVEPGIDRAMANLLQLDDVSNQQEKAADFSLTDQHGNPMSLSEFRGRGVVFTVNDDRCEDLCTLLAQDIVAADRDLRASATKIAFVSINANPFYPSVRDVASWTDAHHLGTLSNWYFGTGEPAQLRRDWQKYGVPVELDPENHTVEHGSQIFFLSPQGQVMALGQFGTESADTAPFAHAMAQMAMDLLPADQRTSVAGPVLTAESSGGALNSTPKPVGLAGLRHPNSIRSIADSRGRFTVLNFWSSSCTACVQELPALEDAHRRLGGSVAFLGDDVADISGEGRAFAAKARADYPLANDPSGRVSGQFRISGLPYTVVLDPEGHVVVRHAGSLTVEQLIYVVQTLKATSRDSAGMSSAHAHSAGPDSG